MTEYDRKQSARKGYNPYALGIYFQALDTAKEHVANGKTLRAALLRCFSDRLLDHVLRAVGEKPFTREEMYAQPLTRD